MIEGVPRVEFFSSFAEQALTGGLSANAIIRGARDLGFGIQRSTALDIIRGIRERTVEEAGRPAALAEQVFPWGTLVQDTPQWDRFDGPNTILFQSSGTQPDEWLDYVIMPEDEDVIGQRFVVQDEDYIDPDREGSGYRTTQSMPADISPRQAAQRLGIDPGSIVRVIFDRP